MKTQSLWLAAVIGVLLVGGTHAKEKPEREEDRRQSTHGINQNLNVQDNGREGNLSTVNGSITIGNRAEVKTVKTVNGAITLGADARAQALETVNGKIEVGPRSTVAENVRTVNGRINVSEGATIFGSVKSANGKILLEKGAHVGRQVSTVAGDITLEDKARIDGGILVEKPTFRGIDSERRVPVVTIGAEAEVHGELVFEIPVKLRVHSTAKIGPVKGADVERI